MALNEQVLLDITILDKASGSLRELRSQSAELRKLLADLTMGTKEYMDTLNKLNEINFLLVETNRYINGRFVEMQGISKSLSSTIGGLSNTMILFKAATGGAAKDSESLLKVMAKLVIMLTVGNAASGLVANITNLRLAMSQLSVFLSVNPYIVLAAAIAALAVATVAYIKSADEEADTLEREKGLLEDLIKLRREYIGLLYEGGDMSPEMYISNLQILLTNVSNSINELESAKKIAKSLNIETNKLEELLNEKYKERNKILTDISSAQKKLDGDLKKSAKERYKELEDEINNNNKTIEILKERQLNNGVITLLLRDLIKASLEQEVIDQRRAAKFAGVLERAWGPSIEAQRQLTKFNADQDAYINEHYGNETKLILQTIDSLEEKNRVLKEQANELRELILPENEKSKEKSLKTLKVVLDDITNLLKEGRKLDSDWDKSLENVATYTGTAELNLALATHNYTLAISKAEYYKLLSEDTNTSLEELNENKRLAVLYSEEANKAEALILASQDAIVTNEETLKLMRLEHLEEMSNINAVGTQYLLVLGEIDMSNAKIAQWKVELEAAADSTELLIVLREKLYKEELKRAEDTIKLLLMLKLAKTELVKSTGDLFGAMAGMFEENTEEYRVFSAILVTIATIVAAMEAYKGFAELGPWGVAAGAVAAAAIGVMGATQVAKIWSTDGKDGSGSGFKNIGAAAQPIPEWLNESPNITESVANIPNELLSTLLNQRVYLVESDLVEAGRRALIIENEVGF